MKYEMRTNLLDAVLVFLPLIAIAVFLGMFETYMSFLSGNLSSLRIPAVISAQKAISAQLSFLEVDSVVTLEVGVSVVLSIMILLFGVVYGTVIIDTAPETITQI